MTQPTGFTMPLSPPRRFICDYLHFARAVPSVPVERRMDLSPLVEARERSSPRPGWCALFVKAWAQVCRRTPALRRCYLGGPSPRLYQHPITVASVAVERPYAGEEAVFFKQLSDCENRPALDIDARLRRFKDAPPEGAASLRRMATLARLPWVLRGPAWWLGLNLSGRLRARMFGTFGVTAYAALGASSLHPISLLTTTLNYGPLDDRGRLDVRVTYDHRVLDGGTVARAMADLERVLTHETVLELGYLRAVAAA